MFGGAGVGGWGGVRDLYSLDVNTCCSLNMD